MATAEGAGRVVMLGNMEDLRRPRRSSSSTCQPKVRVNPERLAKPQELGSVSMRGAAEVGILRPSLWEAAHVAPPLVDKRLISAVTEKKIWLQI